MNTISLSEAKMKLSALLESLNETDEEIIITKNGKPVAVMVSPDEYESWQETMKVRFDSDLMQEIKKGLDELKQDKANLYSLEELLPEQ